MKYLMCGLIDSSPTLHSGPQTDPWSSLVNTLNRRLCIVFVHAFPYFDIVLLSAYLFEQATLKTTKRILPTVSDRCGTHNYLDFCLYMLLLYLYLLSIALLVIVLCIYYSM